MATTLDFIIIIIYLVIVLSIGIYSSKREHLEGYLANNRKTKLFLLTTSSIATLIGAGAVVGVSSAAYTSGISYGFITMISVVVSAVIFYFLAKKIKSFGDKMKAHTVGDFLAYRFGNPTRYMFAVFYLVGALIWIAVQFVAVAQLLIILIGIKFEFALVLTLLITIFYTSLGGLISDMITDFLQFWVMLIVFLIIIPVAWVKSGGVSALTSLSASYFDPLAFGGLTFLIGGIFLSGLVGIAQVHDWQRIYAAESVKTAKRNYLLVIPGAIFFISSAILLGLLAIRIVPGVEPDTAFFTMMNFLLPSGLLGLGYAGIIALVMSSVDSLMIAGSATILKDLYMPLFHPKRHEHELLNMVRYITAIFGILGALIGFLLPDIVNLVLLAAFTTGCLAIPVLSGLFWKRATSKGAITAIICGLATTYVLFPFIPKIAGIPAFFVGFLALVIVSLLTKHSNSENYLLQ